MEVFFIVLSAVLVLALGAMIYYLLAVLKRLYYVSNNITEFYEEVLEYKNHLSYVRKLPLYYDDPVIKELLNHTDYMSSAIEKFGAVMYLLPEEEIQKIIGEPENEEEKSEFNSEEERVEEEI